MLANCTVAVPASTDKPLAPPAATIVFANVMLTLLVPSKTASALTVTAPL